MQRNPRASSVRTFQAFLPVGLALMLLVGMLSISPPDRAAAGVPSTPESLAGAIIDAPTLHDAVAPANEVLVRSGIEVVTPDGSVVIPAVAPASDAKAFDGDAVDLAFDARLPYETHGLSLTETARYLKGFKAPFPRYQDPALALRAMLAAWVTTARTAPDDPVSFNPLFLDAMASRHGIDLATPDYDPSTLRFSELDLQVLSAGFIRDIEVAPPPPSLSGPVAEDSWAESPAVRSVASDLKGCSGLGAELEKINPILSMVVVYAEGMISEAGQNAVSALVSYGADGATKEVTKKMVGKLGKAVEMFLRVAKLAQFYGSVFIRAYPYEDPPTVHKPHDGVNALRHIFAVAGLNPQAAAELEAEKSSLSTVQGMMADCWRAWGFPSLPQVSSLAEGIQNWGVQWKVTPEAMPGDYSIDYKGTKWMSLNSRKTRLDLKLSDTEAAAGIGLLIKPEYPVAPDGKLFTFDIPVEASLDASGVPDISIIGELMKSVNPGAKVVRNGSMNPKKWTVEVLIDVVDPIVYADATVGIAAEMFKGMVRPTTNTVQTVETHIDCSGLSSMPRVLRVQVRASNTCQMPTGWAGTVTWSTDSWENLPWQATTEHIEGTLHLELVNESGHIRYTDTESSDYTFAITGSSDFSSSDPCPSTGHDDWSYGGSAPLTEWTTDGGADQLASSGLIQHGKVELSVDAFGPGTWHSVGNDCGYPSDDSGEASAMLRFTGDTKDLAHAACFPTGVDPDNPPLIDHLGSALIGRWNPTTQALEFNCTKTTSESEVNMADETRTFGYTVNITGELQPIY